MNETTFKKDFLDDCKTSAFVAKTRICEMLKTRLDFTNKRIHWADEYCKNHKEVPIARTDVQDQLAMLHECGLLEALISCTDDLYQHMITDEGLKKIADNTATSVLEEVDKRAKEKEGK